MRQERIAAPAPVLHRRPLQRRRDRPRSASDDRRDAVEAQGRMRELGALGIPFYDALQAVARESEIELVNLCDLLRRHDRFDGPRAWPPDPSA